MCFLERALIETNMQTGPLRTRSSQETSRFAEVRQGLVWIYRYAAPRREAEGRAQGTGLAPWAEKAQSGLRAQNKTMQECKCEKKKWAKSVCVCFMRLPPSNIVGK